jgi:hypothetical protein
VIHWLDVHARGQFEMNNVETSKAAIAKICPILMSYFASGVRPSMFDLSLLHAAARSQRVVLRGRQLTQFVRRPGEGIREFHRRLVSVEADGLVAESVPKDGPPMLAMLYQGDIDLPSGSTSYALFRERATPNLTASDLLS